MATKTFANKGSKRPIAEKTFLYDFGVEGGTNTDTFEGPALVTGNEVIGFRYEVITAPTSGGAATIGISLAGLTGGTDITVLTATAYSDTSVFPKGRKVYIDLSGDTNKVLAETKTVTLDIGTANLTACKIKMTVIYYVQS